MKFLSPIKLPKKTAVKVSDPNNPAWTEGMLGAPSLRPGRVKRMKVESPPETKNPEVAEFEAALLRGVHQALRGEDAARHTKR